MTHRVLILIAATVLAAGCSHPSNTAAAASAPVPAAVAAAPGKQPLPLITADQALPVTDGMTCSAAAAAVGPEAPYGVFAWFLNPEKYRGTSDPFVHKDMAQAVRGQADALIAQANPKHLTAIAITTPKGEDVLNPFMVMTAMQKDKGQGFPVASNYTQQVSFDYNNNSGCWVSFTNSDDFTLLHVNDDTVARAISADVDHRTYQLRILAHPDSWARNNITDADNHYGMTISARIVALQILGPDGTVLAQDPSSP